MLGSSAESEILAAWRRVEGYGLAFGKVCHEWQQKLRAEGKRLKGDGVRPILDKLSIPHSTAYWWINRYKESIGLKDPPAEQHAPAVLPKGTYRIVLADPPWDYRGGCFPSERIGGGGARAHYPCMALEDICSMRLPRIASDSVLFLWATAPLLEDAFKVIAAWDFAYKTNMVWDKRRHNVSHYVSARHEHLLIATRGTCTPDNRKEPPNSVQSIERTKHSRKPEQFRAIIDKLYSTGERVELFARGTLPAGWDGHGYEAAPLSPPLCPSRCTPQEGTMTS